MTSQFGLHLMHSERWNRALRMDDTACPGKDTEDTNCTCPDLVYSTRIRLRDGQTFSNYFYCGCCDLPIVGLNSAHTPSLLEPHGSLGTTPRPKA